VLFLKIALLESKHSSLFAIRDRLTILASMLIEFKTGLNKSRFLHNCNLNWEQLNVYLDFLLLKNMIARKVGVDGSGKLVTTQKGNFFVKEFLALQDLLE
jgi:predicted transcriptional regulator